jgi:Domain of unknown function (DUF4124)
VKRATFTAAASLSLLLVASWSTAGSPQLFKCVEGGRTVYQQQACPVTAQLEPMANSPHPATQASEPAPKIAARLKPASPASPASSAPATLR